VEQVYTRAHELCQRVGENPQLFPALWGIWRFYNTQGKYRTSRALRAQLLTLEQQVPYAGLLLQVHHALWSTLFPLGDLAAARAPMQEEITLYDHLQHRAHVFRYGGHDPGVCCR
jgi:predicted ATPase